MMRNKWVKNTTIEVKNPKCVHIKQESFSTIPERDGNWHAACLNPKYDPDPPEPYYGGQIPSKLYDTPEDYLRNQKYLSFHPDGWRTIMINELKEFTGWFKSKDDLLDALKKFGAPKPIEFKGIFDQINYENGFIPDYLKDYDGKW